MKFHVVTLFPEVIDSYTKASIIGRAQKEGKIEVVTHQLRDFVENKWGKADERPYGGGPGMVLQAEPFVRAVAAIEKKIHEVHLANVMIYHNEKGKEKSIKNTKNLKVLITSAGGKPLTNAFAKKLAKEENVVILCGRYEGIDSRVPKILKSLGMKVEEVSVGPYILTGGELPALTIIDTTARQIPGVLGKFESLEEARVASHEIYTRPEVIEWQDKTGKLKKYKVPKVLLSGNHAKMDEFKNKKRSDPSATEPSA